MARSMHGHIATWRVVFALVLTIATSEFACSQEKFKAPKIWDSQKLAGWGMPLAHQGIHENFIGEERYYSSPSDNVRTYPVYHPLKEPAGYWEWLNQLDPEPLVSKGEARTEDEWAQLGREVFDGLDIVQFRTDDPDAIAFLRDPKKFVEEEVVVDADFTIPNFRWVVEEKGKIRVITS